MGTCYGRCCPQKKQRRYKRSHYFDGESVVEFENLIDESPKEAVSIVTCREKEILANRQFDLLVEEQQKENANTVAEHAMEEKELELEEAAAIEARKEALRIMKMAQSPDIINPAKLAIVSNQMQLLGEKAENLNVSGQECGDTADPEVKATKVFNSWRKKNSESTANYSKDNLCTYSSTPPSSIDLEWENEIGMTISQQPTRTEEDYGLIMSDTNSVYSNCSTQISNGNELEWDGDFTSTHISEIDLETERLISEIEQMTSNALNNSSPKR